MRKRHKFTAYTSLQLKFVRSRTKLLQMMKIDENMKKLKKIHLLRQNRRNSFPDNPTFRKISYLLKTVKIGSDIWCSNFVRELAAKIAANDEN